MTGETLEADVRVDRGRFVLDVALDVRAGEALAVMGPSGSGKSTLLGALAGLVPMTHGRIRFGDALVLDDTNVRRAHVPPNRRGIVLLRQDPHLFPHMTARENIAFGPRADGVDARGARSVADEWLQRVGLDGLGTSHPAELSGGQQQRVAIARALATSPRALLLDEPLLSLDPETASGIRSTLRDQLAVTGTTLVLSTHDPLDAVALAQRLVVIEDGVVTQRGPVRDVLAAPATRFVAAVSGLNRVDGVVRDGVWVADGVRLAASGVEDGTRAAVFRPSHVRLALPPDAVGAPGTNAWSARVTRLEQTPAGVRIRTAGPDVAIDLPADAVAGLALAPDVTVELSVAPGAVRFVA